MPWLWGGARERRTAEEQHLHAAGTNIDAARIPIDTEVVTAGMAAWKVILVRYLQVETPVWSDALIEWLFARSQELVDFAVARAKAGQEPKGKGTD